MKAHDPAVGTVPTPRDVLNELKWRQDALDEAVVYYVHRGAPDDTRTLTGDRILGLHQSWIEIPGPEGSTMIPYHRVFRIDQGEKTVWLRRQDPDLGDG